MKRVIATSALGLFAIGAQAQSSVTLYGVVDTGIGYLSSSAPTVGATSGGHSAVKMINGIWAGSRFGLKGSEDLGGGNRAIFKLESGFNIGNGQFGGWLNNNVSQGMFNRQAYVGLSNNTYGTLTLGRQYDSVVDYLGPLSLAGKGVNLAAHPFNNDNIDAQYAISNAVKYESANYAGFHFGGMYSFSNTPDGFSNGRQWSVGLGYAKSRPEELATIRDVARADGVVLDPVYTGKAFHGVVTELRANPRRFGDAIAFVHTGGMFGLFAAPPASGASIADVL